MPDKPDHERETVKARTALLLWIEPMVTKDGLAQFAIGLDRFESAIRAQERAKVEVENAVGDSFYRVTVEQRDAAWREVESLRAKAHVAGCWCKQKGDWYSGVGDVQYQHPKDITDPRCAERRMGG